MLTKRQYFKVIHAGDLRATEKLLDDYKLDNQEIINLLCLEPGTYEYLSDEKKQEEEIYLYLLSEDSSNTDLIPKHLHTQDHFKYLISKGAHGKILKALKKDELSDDYFFECAKLNSTVFEEFTDVCKRKKEVVLAVLKQDGMILRLLTDFDAEIIMTALNQNLKAFEYVPNQLLYANNQEFLLEVIKNHPDGFQDIHDFLNHYIENMMMKNNEFLTKALELNPRSLYFCHNFLDSNKNFQPMLDAVKRDGYCLEFLNEEFKDSINLKEMKEIIGRDGYPIVYASKQQKNNIELMLIALQQIEKKREKISHIFRKKGETDVLIRQKNINIDRDYAYNTHYFKSTIIGDSLKTNTEFLFGASNIDPFFLKYLTPEQREIVFEVLDTKKLDTTPYEVLKQYWSVEFLNFQYFFEHNKYKDVFLKDSIFINRLKDIMKIEGSKRIQYSDILDHFLRTTTDPAKKKDMLKIFVRKQTSTFDLVPEYFMDDEDFILDLVKQNGMVIGRHKFLKKYHNDDEIIYEAVKNNFLAFEKVENCDYRNIKELNLLVIKQYPAYLLKVKKENILREAIRLNVLNLRYIPKFQNDRVIVSNCIDVNIECFKYASSKLKIELFKKIEDKLTTNIVEECCMDDSDFYDFIQQIEYFQKKKHKDPIIEEDIVSLNEHDNYSDSNLMIEGSHQPTNITNSEMSGENEIEDNMKEPKRVLDDTPLDSTETINESNMTVDWGKILVQDGMKLNSAPYDIKNNASMVLKALSVCKMAVKYASDELKDNEEFALSIPPKGNQLSFEYLSENLQNNKTVIKHFLPLKGRLEYIKFDQLDEEFIGEMITVDPKVYEYLTGANEKLRERKDFALLYLDSYKSDLIDLKFIPDTLKKDHDIIMKLLQINKNRIDWIDKTALEDKDLVLKLMELDFGELITHEVVNVKFGLDFEVVMKSVEKGCPLSKIHPKWMSNEVHPDKDSIIFQAIIKDAENFNYLCKSNPQFAKEPSNLLKCVRLNPLCYQYLKQYKDDVDFLEEAIVEESNFTCIPIQKLNDKKFIISAIRKNHKIYTYLPADLKKQSDIYILYTGFLKFKTMDLLDVIFNFK